jgi:cytochrome P450
MLQPLSFVMALWNNPIEAWTREHFERPIVIVPLPFAEVAIVSDPVAIRRVLADNSGNYRKDQFQKRMLAVLSNGLLTVEGDEWRRQRRVLTPIFALKNVRKFVPAMLQAVGGLIERWSSWEGKIIDVADEVTELALFVLERTIFSEGIAGNDSKLRAAMRVYFDSLGRIDPFDFLNLPDLVPRLGRLRARPAIQLLHNTIDEMIAIRSCRNGRTAALPEDLLSQMLSLHDLETGRKLTTMEIRANVLTFMAAGHESTANAIAWTLFLLSRSPAWRERLVAEAIRKLDGPTETLPDCLVETRAVVEEALRLYPPPPVSSPPRPCNHRRGSHVLFASAKPPIPPPPKAVSLAGAFGLLRSFPGAPYHPRRSSSGSRAMLIAMRRASSSVNTLACSASASLARL